MTALAGVAARGQGNGSRCRAGDAEVLRNRCRSPAGPLLIAVLLALTGCSLLRREEYSLIVRHPAHRYRVLTAGEREELELYERTRVTRATGFVDRVAHEPFRPFRYCHRHDSHHVAESLVAFVAAPVEYPAAIGGDLGGAVARDTPRIVAGLAGTVADGAVWFWERVFPPREPPPVPPPPVRESESPPR